MTWEYATMEISAVQPVTPEPASRPDDTAEWQAYAIGPTGELIFEEYRPYHVAWARLFAEHLNRLGRDGWELVSGTPPQQALSPAGAGRAAHPSVVESRFVFRRPATAG